MKPLIAVVDYGMGNLHSVGKALEKAGARVRISSSPTLIRQAAGVVLPGVGSFGEAMKRLAAKKLISGIMKTIEANKPFLGICLGLQLLFDRSEESPKAKGLSILKGDVVKFTRPFSRQGASKADGFKVPHMGWNTIERGPAGDTPLLDGISSHDYFYFVHSFFPVPEDLPVVATRTVYGRPFCSAVAQGRLFASQFHPEKSGDKGQAILRNYVQEVVMLVIPAIDIRHGHCVRLYQGKEDHETVYWKDPVEMANIWIARGATILHIADLDGAFQGRPANLDKLERMRKSIQVPIQIGGGFRSIESIQTAIAMGASRVILGTAAVYNPSLVGEALDQFGDAIAVSIDVSEDFVAVSGWKELSSMRFDDLALRMKSLGVKHLLFTDTRKDGTLTGPSIDGIRLFLKAAAGVPVTVSGGISSIDDIIALREFEPEGLGGVIIGKALYDRKFTLDEAIKVAGNQES